MRYKAAPLSVRTTPPAPRRSARFTSDSFRLVVIALLVPVILIPLVVANAAGSMTLSPSQAIAGATVVTTAVGLQPNTRGQLAFDGRTTGMPTFRVDRTGRMRATFTVPTGAAVGAHTVTATVTGKKAARAAEPTASGSSDSFLLA